MNEWANEQINEQASEWMIERTWAKIVSDKGLQYFMNGSLLGCINNCRIISTFKVAAFV